MVRPRPTETDDGNHNSGRPWTKQVRLAEIARPAKDQLGGVVRIRGQDGTRRVYSPSGHAAVVRRTITSLIHSTIHNV